MRSEISRFLCELQLFLEHEEAQDLVEYALVVALIAFGATASLHTLGVGLNHVFTSISSTLASAY
jgi:pilus assembly protein Flp/PilA